MGKNGEWEFRTREALPFLAGDYTKCCRDRPERCADGTPACEHSGSDSDWDVCSADTTGIDFSQPCAVRVGRDPGGTQPASSRSASAARRSLSDHAEESRQVQGAQLRFLMKFLDISLVSLIVSHDLP